MISRANYVREKEPHTFYSLLFGIPLIITVLFYGISQTYYVHQPDSSMFHSAYFLTMGFFLFMNICLWQKHYHIKTDNIPASLRWQNTYPNIIGFCLFVYAILQVN